MGRRRLEMALGGIWLLDGALQFQPYMFSKAFLPSLLGMANMGLPAPLSALLALALWPRRRSTPGTISPAG